jgi:hypothetical protein
MSLKNASIFAIAQDSYYDVRPAQNNAAHAEGKVSQPPGQVNIDTPSEAA